MSIIYDALKKAEQSIETNSQANVKTNKSRPPFKLKIYLIYILVMCSGLLVGNSIFIFLNQPKISIVEPKELSGAINKARPLTSQTSIIQAPVSDSSLKPAASILPKEPMSSTAPMPPDVSSDTRKSTRGMWVLNGVFFSEDQGYALVNNQIVKVGDTVSGAVVKRINLNEVVLETKDGQVNLSNSISSIR